jgi:hypothetical protein
MDARGEASLVDEHRAHALVLRELRVEPLDSDRTGESNGPEQSPEVDARHPARCDLTEERIPTHDRRGRPSSCSLTHVRSDSPVLSALPRAGGRTLCGLRLARCGQRALRPIVLSHSLCVALN